MRSGQEWLPLQAGGKSWTKDPKADLFFDTFNGVSEDQRGHFVVRCRVCALEGTTSTYLLCGGKSSNAWKHFDLVARSRLSSGVQRSRHGTVSSYRREGKDATKVNGGAAEGLMSQYLTASRNRVLGPAQARPHRIRFVLMLAMTLSRFYRSGNITYKSLCGGFGSRTPHPRRLACVTFYWTCSILCQILCGARCVSSNIATRDCCSSTSSRTSGRNATGLDLTALSFCGVLTQTALPCAICTSASLFSGRHEHDNIKRWVLHQLARFGVKEQEVSSSTTDSGSNVKKALRQL